MFHRLSRITLGLHLSQDYFFSDWILKRLMFSVKTHQVLMIRIQFCIKSRGYTLLMYGMITYRHYSNKLKVFWDAHKTCTNHEENSYMYMCRSGNWWRKWWLNGTEYVTEIKIIFECLAAINIIVLLQNDCVDKQPLRIVCQFYDELQ